MKSFLLWRSVALSGVLILAACAGGGETGTGLEPTDGSGKDVSVGTITAFGSVWVNGVEFETPATQVTVEGAISSTDALRLGMVVTVKGTINADKVSGIADAISVKTVMIGPVTAVAASALTVLGQTVEINAATKFEDDIVLANLPGLVVEISGVIKSAGVIVATRIELKEPREEYKLRGIVSEIGTTGKTFKIGMLVVDYTELNEVVPAVGMIVKVKGRVSSTGVLNATELEAEKLEVEEADNFEMEGFVAGASPIAGGIQFSVNNVTVQTSALTEFEGGPVSALLNGVYVQIEGPLMGGIVIANKVELKDPVTLELGMLDY